MGETLFSLLFVLVTLVVLTLIERRKKTVNWRKLEKLSWATFGIIVILTVINGGMWYWSEITQDRQPAVLYVQKHYSPSQALDALNPDLPSATWSAESKDLDCLSTDYQCTNVHYSFNVMTGAEVKRLDCVWQVQSSWGTHKILSAEPKNTEARQIFVGLPPS